MLRGKVPETKSDLSKRKQAKFVEHMPDKMTLRKVHKGRISNLKERILRDVAQNNVCKQGNLQVNEIHDRFEKVRTSAID